MEGLPGMRIGMETKDTDLIAMNNANHVDLNAHEQEVYLQHLIAKIGNPDNRHERLTAKAYQAILDCLHTDAKTEGKAADND